MGRLLSSNAYIMRCIRWSSNLFSASWQVATLASNQVLRVMRPSFNQPAAHCKVAKAAVGHCKQPTGWLKSLWRFGVFFHNFVVGKVLKALTSDWNISPYEVYNFKILKPSGSTVLNPFPLLRAVVCQIAPLLEADLAPIHCNNSLLPKKSQQPARFVSHVFGIPDLLEETGRTARGYELMTVNLGEGSHLLRCKRRDSETPHGNSPVVFLALALLKPAAKLQWVFRHSYCYVARNSLNLKVINDELLLFDTNLSNIFQYQCAMKNRAMLRFLWHVFSVICDCIEGFFFPATRTLKRLHVYHTHLGLSTDRTTLRMGPWTSCRGVRSFTF